MAKEISGLVVAAGLSSRMGVFKPLLKLRGKTVIENSVGSVLDGGARTVVVVTGYRADEIESLLHNRFGERVLIVRNDEYYATDMLASVKIGCAKLPAVDAFYLLPGDMPTVKKSTFELLRAEWEKTGGVVFPTLDGHRKHPPLISGELAGAIAAFHAEGGLRQFWKIHEDIAHEVSVKDEGVSIDLDFPEDYERCKLLYEP